MPLFQHAGELLFVPCPLRNACSPASQAQGSCGGRGGGGCRHSHRRAWSRPAAALCAGAPQQLWRADIPAALSSAAGGLISSTGGSWDHCYLFSATHSDYSLLAHAFLHGAASTNFNYC